MLAFSSVGSSVIRVAHAAVLIFTACGPGLVHAGEGKTLSTNPLLARATAPDKAASPEGIYQRARQSVVMISTPAGKGSGVVIKGGDPGSLFPNTWIATNAHVVGNAKTVEVEIGSMKLEGLVAARDAAWDISIVRLEMTDLPAIAIGEAAPVRVGNKVYALGAPRGLGASFSDGIVSALRIIAGNSVIQTTAPISPGSSGGALLDASGKLVGITTFKVNGGEGLNFAVDVKLAQRLLEAEIAAVSIRLTVAQENRDSLGDPFVKWLATSYAEGGRTTMAQYEEILESYNARKTTPEHMIGSLFAIASRYNAETPIESLPQTPQTPQTPQSPRRVTLTCQLGNGTSQQYVINFAMSTVNGWSARITDATVAFSYTNSTNSRTDGVIDRVNGTILLSAGRPIGGGECAVLKGDAF